MVAINTIKLLIIILELTDVILHLCILVVGSRFCFSILQSLQPESIIHEAMVFAALYIAALKSPNNSITDISLTSARTSSIQMSAALSCSPTLTEWGWLPYHQAHRHKKKNKKKTHIIICFKSD